MLPWNDVKYISHYCCRISSCENWFWPGRRHKTLCGLAWSKLVKLPHESIQTFWWTFSFMLDSRSSLTPASLLHTTGGLLKASGSPAGRLTSVTLLPWNSQVATQHLHYGVELAFIPSRRCLKLWHLPLLCCTSIQSEPDDALCHHVNLHVL